MRQNTLKKFLTCIFIISVFYGCSSSENTVVVVEDTPQTIQAAEPDSAGEQFTQLSIGLIDSVTNFDPLFADNLSTQRTLSLIYEGLYTLDRKGNPVPAIASGVEISDDSLEYVFTLNPNKFYHNSRIFNTGIGRRVSATDVKQAFERTAKLTVPDHAAQLLMDVSGFENYFLEQRTVYDSEKRVLGGVGGIQVIDQQTVAIILEEPDSNFLMKLASPYLFIYPNEAVSDNSSALFEQPVGTGPYQFNRVESNGQIVLMRSESRSNQQNRSSLVNRINLQTFTDETELFQQFNRNQTDWIPEIGPEITDQVLDEDGNGDLQTSYQENMNLVRNDASRIAAFYLHEDAEIEHHWLKNRLAYLTAEDFMTRGEITLNVDDIEISDQAEPREQYFAAYTEDALTRRILTELHNIILMPESSLVLFDIRVPTRQTSIYTTKSSSLRDEVSPIEDGYWMKINTPIYGLYNNRVDGIAPTSVPWLLHIGQVRVQNSQFSSQ